jgi:hypothetical protein
MLSKKIPLVKLVAELKANSSRWFKTKDKSLQSFYWQNGYGAFSISVKAVPIVHQYIINQKRHHERRTFQTEYRTLLNKYDVNYDERFVWD